MRCHSSDGVLVQRPQVAAARVVEQQRDAPELTVRGRDCGRQRVRVGDVDGTGDAVDLVRHCGGPIAVDVEDRDASAVLGEAPARCRADPGPRRR